MAVARVQAIGNAGAGVSSLAVGSGQGWATPTSGNLLVVTGNSDATITGPSGFTAGPSVVDGNGAYMWWKVSNGTESTITITPGSAANTAMTAAEYSGLTATPLDASNSSTIASSSGTSTTSTSLTTTAASDLWVAAALLHGYSGSAPTSPTWTNSLANQLSPSSGSGVATHCTTFYADLLDAGAAGAHATSASWTNAANDRQEIVMAFLATATSGGSAPPAVVTAPASRPPQPGDAVILAPQNGQVAVVPAPVAQTPTPQLPPAPGRAVVLAPQNGQVAAIPAPAALVVSRQLLLVPRVVIVAPNPDPGTAPPAANGPPSVVASPAVRPPGAVAVIVTPNPDSGLTAPPAAVVATSNWWRTTGDATIVFPNQDSGLTAPPSAVIARPVAIPPPGRSVILVPTPPVPSTGPAAVIAVAQIRPPHRVLVVTPNPDPGSAPSVNLLSFTAAPPDVAWRAYLQSPAWQADVDQGRFAADPPTR